MIRRTDGAILAFERADVPGAWQLPQGGMDGGEHPQETVWREIAEETGLTADHLELVAEFPDWVAYEVPEDKRSNKTGIGQVQRWYLFQVKSDDIEPTPDQREFTAWKWVTPSWLVEHVVEFRTASYRRVLGTF